MDREVRTNLRLVLPNILIRHFNSCWISIIIVLVATRIRCTNNVLMTMRLASISQVSYVEHGHGWPPRTRQSCCSPSVDTTSRHEEARERANASRKLSCRRRATTINAFTMNVCVHSFVRSFIRSLARSFTREHRSTLYGTVALKGGVLHAYVGGPPGVTDSSDTRCSHGRRGDTWHTVGRFGKLLAASQWKSRDSLFLSLSLSLSE